MYIHPPRRAARVNVKALVLLTTIVVVLAAGALTVRYVRKRVVAAHALETALAAFEQQDWETAHTNFKVYLERRPTDETENRHIEIPLKYAQSLLNVRPLTPDQVAAALGAYRRVLRLDPQREETYAALSKLYIDLRNFEELAYIARKRQEIAPDDPRVPIWFATVHIVQRKLDQARTELENLINRLEAETASSEEYVLACVMLSRIAESSVNRSDSATPAEWLNRAVEHDPDSAVARLRRAEFHNRRARRDLACQPLYLDAARSDLNALTNNPDLDLPTRLQLGEAWLKLGEIDRALEQVTCLEQADPNDLHSAFGSATDWTLFHFLLKGDALLRAHRLADAAALADTAIPILAHDNYRQRALPLAVRIYARHHDFARSRQLLDEYRTLATVSEAQAADNIELAILEAHLARESNQPFKVINLLEPFADREDADPALRKLLADAYQQTNQPRRALELIEQYAAHAGGQTEPSIIIRLARARLDSGRFDEALRLLEPLIAYNVDAAALCLEVRLRALIVRATAPTPDELEYLSDQITALSKAHPAHAGAQILRASLALAVNDVPAAEACLHQAVRSSSNPLAPARTLLRLYLADDRAHDALALAQDLCKRLPADPQAWLALADIHTILNQAADARATLETALKKVTEPTGHDLLALRLATHDLRHDRRESGINRLRQLASAEPPSVEACALLLSLPETLAQTTAAQQLVDKLKAAEGDHGLRWRLHQAALWLNNDDRKQHLDDAQDLLQYCVEADPGWPAPAILLGRLYRFRNQPDAAERVYRAVLAANALAGEVTAELLRLLETQGRYDDALQLMETTRAAGPITAAARVRTLLGAGEVDRAIAELERQLAADPNDLDSRVALAELLHHQRHAADRALQLLSEVPIAKRTPAVVRTRAAILRDAGQTQQARQAFDSLIQRTPTPAAYLARATLLASLNDLDAAEADLRHVAENTDEPRGYLVLGLFYAEHDRLDDAIATWQQALEKHPDHREIRRRLAMALLARHQGDDEQRGLDLLAQLEHQQPDDPDILWIRAMLLLAQRQPEANRQAEQLLEQIVNRRPTAINAHRQLIDLALDAADLDRARNLAVRAVQANPQSSILLLVRARVELQLNNLDSAALSVEQALERDPDDPDTLDLFARLALARRTPDALAAAASALHTARARLPDDPRLLPAQILIAQARHDTAQVESLLKELHALAGPLDTARALLDLAELHFSTGDLEATQRRVAAAAELAPDEPAVLHLRIRALAAADKYDDLIALVRGPYPNPPFTADVLHVAASALSASPNPSHRDLTRILYNHALAQVAPGSAQWFDLVAGLYTHGDLDRVETLYRDLLEQDPDNPRALNDLAWILAESKQAYTAALTLADQGLELDPDNHHLLDTRGSILAKLPERLTDARRDLQHCADLYPAGSAARARALLKLARVTARLDDPAATQRYLREAREIDQRLNILTPDERDQLQSFLEQATASDT